MPSYLEALTLRLAHGVAALPEGFRQRQIEFLDRSHRSDGGFGGRMGGSDLYYTGFACRSMSLLGHLYGPPAERVEAFLKTKLGGQESIVDALSLVYSGQLLAMSAGIDLYKSAQPNWRQATAELLESLRREDGGYAKGPEGTASSTYHTFLVLLCLELLEIPPRDPTRIVEFVRSQADPEGGFHEIKASKRAGVNPTAAAIGALQILGALTPDLAEPTIDYLLEMQTDEGGFRANTRIPIADLLSTFTTLLTLQDLGGANAVDTRAVQSFALSLAHDEGGFSGAHWDTGSDVEYSFYGLGCLALLAT